MKFSLRTLLYNKKFMCAFSIVAAFALWLMISIYQNPVREHTISNVTVNISTDGTIVSERGMDIVNGGNGEKVNVKVSGPNYIVSSLSASDILVSASFDNVKDDPGTYDLQLVATQNSSKSGYTFLSISPSTIKVTIDSIDTKEFTVVPVANGAGAVSGLVVDTPVVSDSGSSTVTIKGARTNMEKIDKVVAAAEVNKTLSATESFKAEIKLLDVNGNELDKTLFTISAENVDISVPISQKAQVPISVVFANAPVGYESFLKYSVEHTTVTVLGPPDIIGSLEKIELDPINFFNISKTNNSFDVAPKLPNGVKMVDKITDITVSINTSSFSERVFTVNNFEYKNVDSLLKASTSQAIRNVTICGPSSTIKSLSADDIFAEVDLSGKAAGEHTVSAKILARDSEKIWQVGEYTAIITLK